MNFLAKNIKKIRENANLTQKEVAHLFDLEVQTISSYELGRSNPSIQVLILMSDYFQITIDDLLKKDLSASDLPNPSQTKPNRRLPKHSSMEDIKEIKEQLAQYVERLELLENLIKNK